MNQLTKRTSNKQINTSNQEIRLEYIQAFRLLDALENLSPNSDQDFAMEQLREDLDDACWLAQWKREYVVMDEARISSIELASPQ